MSKVFVAYYKREWGQEIPDPLNEHEFLFYFCHVKSMIADNLDEVYYNMQGDIWSPNGEQREYIKALGLQHTSMSVGDVIYSAAEHKYFMVDTFGFKEISLTKLE